MENLDRKHALVDTFQELNLALVDNPNTKQAKQWEIPKGNMLHFTKKVMGITGIESRPLDAIFDEV